MMQRPVYCAVRAIQVTARRRARFPLQATSPTTTTSISPRIASSTSTFINARYASSTSSEKAQVPPTQQPSTSPDRQESTLSERQGTSGASLAGATVSQKESDESSSQEEASTSEEHTLMSEQEKEILAKLQQEFPGGSVAVQDVSGGCGTFFAISVESGKFKGLSRIKQHQLVNKALSDEVKTWHGMQLKTVAI